MQLFHHSLCFVGVFYTGISWRNTYLYLRRLHGIVIYVMLMTHTNPLLLGNFQNCLWTQPMLMRCFRQIKPFSLLEQNTAEFLWLRPNRACVMSRAWTHTHGALCERWRRQTRTSSHTNKHMCMCVHGRVCAHRPEMMMVMMMITICMTSTV